MSKNQKKKVTVKVMPGEAIFVASLEVMEHIYSTYMHLASEADSQDVAAWVQVADQIKEWSERTYYSDYKDNNDEEW